MVFDSTQQGLERYREVLAEYLKIQQKIREESGYAFEDMSSLMLYATDKELEALRTASARLDGMKDALGLTEEEEMRALEKAKEKFATNCVA